MSYYLLFTLQKGGVVLLLFFGCKISYGFTFISVVSSMTRNIRHLGMLPIGGIDHIIYELSQAQDLDPLTELN